MMGLASPGLLTAGMLLQSQDGLTLSPLPIVQTHCDEPAAAMDMESPAPGKGMSVLEQPISLDARAIPLPPSDDLGGFIYEPVYATKGDRVEYQLGSGLGLGVATDAAWSISHSVRLGRGLGLSVYYLRAIGDGSRDTVRGAGVEMGTGTPETSAGIRLEWKF